MAQCRECKKAIKWIEVAIAGSNSLHWRMFDKRKSSFDAYKPHDCEKKKNPPPKRESFLKDPWWW